MNKKIVGKYKTICIMFIFLLAAVCKYFQFTVLPSKYFIDSNKILLMIENPEIIRSTSYIVTANFFRMINILNFSTLLEWSIFITILYNIIFFFFLFSYKQYNVFQIIFIFISMILLDIFSFNLGKEVIQIFIFIMIYIVLINRKISSNKKIFLINIILLFETIFFREYYILVLLGVDLTFWFLNRKMKFNVLEKIFMILGIFLITLSVSKFIVPNYYNELLRIRTINETNLVEANTLIRNVFSNNSSNLFYCINYIINFFRILCPVEIITKGIKYIFFALYQLSVVYIIIKAIRKNDKKNYLVLSVVIGYFLASVTFEPDFGSVVRHESTMFLIILLLEKYHLVFEKSEDENGKK